MNSDDGNHYLVKVSLSSVILAKYIFWPFIFDFRQTI